jgi:hypothetical protein
MFVLYLGPELTLGTYSVYRKIRLRGDPYDHSA